MKKAFATVTVFTRASQGSDLLCFLFGGVGGGAGWKAAPGWGRDGVEGNGELDA